MFNVSVAIAHINCEICKPLKKILISFSNQQHLITRFTLTFTWLKTLDLNNWSFSTIELCISVYWIYRAFNFGLSFIFANLSLVFSTWEKTEMKEKGKLCFDMFLCILIYFTLCYMFWLWHLETRYTLHLLLNAVIFWIES